MGKETEARADGNTPGAAGTLGKAAAKGSGPEWRPLRDVSDFPWALGCPDNHPHKAIIPPQGSTEERAVGIN